MSGSVLEDVAAGKPGAIEACIDEFGGLVWSIARRYCGNDADADDMTQEIFMELWRKADRYDASQASVATYITMIARRRLIDRSRRSERALPTTPIDLDDDGLTMFPVVDSLELADEAAKAAVCMERLTDRQKKVLILSIHHGLTHAGISSRLGVPLGTVKSTARRSLLMLRECMQKDAGFATRGIAT